LKVNLAALSHFISVIHQRPTEQTYWVLLPGPRCCAIWKFLCPEPAVCWWSHCWNQY